VLAQAEFDRAKRLLATKVTSAEDFDQKREQLDVANAQVKQALAYFDTFLIFAVLAVALTFLVLRMKRSVAERGAHVAAE
jgi:hypothetical protein